MTARLLRARFDVAREAGHTPGCALAFSRSRNPVLRAACVCGAARRSLRRVLRWTPSAIACAWCGGPRQGEHATYCSDACRAKAWRRRVSA